MHHLHEPNIKATWTVVYNRSLENCIAFVVVHRLLHVSHESKWLAEFSLQCLWWLLVAFLCNYSNYLLFKLFEADY